MKLVVFTLFTFITVSHAQTQTGKASFYADSFEGRRTASGEKYAANKFTAAHRTLPFGTVISVTNLANNESIDVTVNDRGPFVVGRVVDVSKAAAKKLGFLGKGVAEVKIVVIKNEEGRNMIEPATTVETGADSYYSFNVSKVEPKGFGVQVATYQELVNLFKITDDVKNEYKKNAIVRVKVVNGLKYYSLILGPFSSREKAERFAKEEKKQFPDAFVLDYSTHK